MHCGITHLIAHKSTVLTKASCWPFTGRVDSTRRSSPSQIPCKWPAALYLEVPGNQDVVRSTKILAPRAPQPLRMLPPPGPRPAYGTQPWLDLPAESKITTLIGGHDRRGHNICCHADGVPVSHVSYGGSLDRGTARMLIFYLPGPHL